MSKLPNTIIQTFAACDNKHSQSTKVLENNQKNTTPVRFRNVQVQQTNNNPLIDNNLKTQGGYPHALINKLNKENLENNYMLTQPSPTKGITKGKSGNIAEYTNNIGIMKSKSPKSQSQFTGINQQLYNTVKQNYQLKDENMMFSVKKNSVLSPTNMNFQSSRSPEANEPEGKKLKINGIEEFIKNSGKQYSMKKSQSKCDILNSKTSNNGENQIIQKMESKKSFKVLAKQLSNNKKIQKLACMNDGKKAKYRVRGQQQDDDSQPMYCCSKCAICLVQQGFKVIQIQKKPEEIQYNQELSQFWLRIGDLNKKLNVKKQKIKKIKENNQKKYQPDIDRIDSYYNQLISALQKSRVRDHQIIINTKNYAQRDIESLEKHIIIASERLIAIDNEIKLNSTKSQTEYEDRSRFIKQYNEQVKQLSKMIELPQKCYEKDIEIQSSNEIEQKLHRFTQLLESQLHIQIKKSMNQQQQQLSERSNSMIDSKIHSSKLVANQKQTEHKTELMKQSNMLQIQFKQQQKRPFRNLFPQQSDQQVNSNYQQNDQPQPEQTSYKINGSKQQSSPTFSRN